MKRTKSAKKKGVGLALSGGATRGFAHIGVVKVLQSNEIPIDFVAGTSVGSIVGALVCGGYTWEQMTEITKEIEWRKLVSPTFSGMGLVGSEKLGRFVDELLGEVDFSELKIPFRAVAVDIARAKEIVFSSGSVARAVRASCAVPGIFEPLVEDDQALVDGGVINNLPTDVVREMGARTVIAVDLNRYAASDEVPRSLLDITYRSFAILLSNTSVQGREDADILIQPELEGFSYHDLSRADELIALGEEAAMKALPRMQRLR